MNKKTKIWVTYERAVTAGTVAIADDGRLGCRCDDVVYSPEHDLMLVDRRQENIVSGHNDCQASDRNTYARHRDGRPLRLPGRDVGGLLHGTLSLYRISKRKM